MTTARTRPAPGLAVASGVDLAMAIDAFLSQPDLVSTTRAKYRQTLTVLEDELGDAPATATATATGPGLAGVVAQRWHHASPATWNRHVATVRSFARYCTRTRILNIDVARCRVGGRDDRQQRGAGQQGDGASHVSSRSALRARGAQTAEKRGLAASARRR